MWNKFGVMQVVSWEIHRHAIIIDENRAKILLNVFRLRVDKLALRLPEGRIGHAGIVAVH